MQNSPGIEIPFCTELNLWVKPSYNPLLISGTSPAGTAYIERDDDGPGRDARIRRNLSPGHYTIAATTYRDDATGTWTYTLEVDGHD